MKKYILMFLFVAALCLPFGTGSAEPSGDSDAEWTVMFYLCGADLESKYGYATQTLREIVQSQYTWSGHAARTEGIGPDGELLAGFSPDSVNVVIETGGCQRWLTNRDGEPVTDAPVREDALQRWSCDLSPEAEDDLIRLREVLPLQSMADPQTLTDFIRWSVKNYPARKYLLVLWGHGGGSKTGIFVDELYNKDMMYVYELGEALDACGVELEAVLFDACMMANIETAAAIQDNARWMVASEEVVMGEGTAVRSWLRELISRPEMDGRRLGRVICNSAQERSALDQDRQSVLLLTWSVIDLSAIGRVVEYMDNMFKMAARVYKSHPKLLSRNILQYFDASERYGSSEDRMIDMTDPLLTMANLQSDAMSLRNGMLSALEDAVVYCVRGSGRAKAKGLSICYAASMTSAELDIYARNCPSPHYLALLDAITPWTAPESIYEQVERLPEIDTLKGYEIIVEKRMGADGVPGIAIVGSDANVNAVNCYFYRLNEETGNVVSLGYVPTGVFPTADGREQMSIIEPWEWPHVEDELCCLNLIQHIYNDSLCEIPLRVDVNQYYFRSGYTPERGYVIYGIWEGFNSTTNMFNRNVLSLSRMVGQDYELLYPIIDLGDTSKIIDYELGKTQTMYRAMEIESQPLPPGTYFIQYAIEDMFMRRIRMDCVEIEWDGKRLTLPKGVEWQDSVTLRWREIHSTND